MKLLILAAGYGTRLGDLVKDTPKPLLEVAGTPIINYILDRVKGVDDLDEILVVTNSKFTTHFQQWAKENESFPAKITIFDDGTSSNDDRLGSIGDINFVFQNGKIDDDVLVVGGDNIFDFDLNEYIQFARKNKPKVTIGVYDIGNIEEATKFGIVALGEGGIITSFEEKPAKPKSSNAAMCFYYLPKESLGDVAKYIEETGKTDKAGEFIRWISEKSQAYGFSFEGKWYDIGSIESFNEAQTRFSQ